MVEHWSLSDIPVLKFFIFACTCIVLELLLCKDSRQCVVIKRHTEHPRTLATTMQMKIIAWQLSQFCCSLVRLHTTKYYRWIEVCLVSLLLTLNRFHTMFWYFHSWLWTRICRLVILLRNQSIFRYAILLVLCLSIQYCHCHSVLPLFFSLFDTVFCDVNVTLPQFMPITFSVADSDWLTLGLQFKRVKVSQVAHY